MLGNLGCEFFGGLIFGPRIFWGFVGSAREFLVFHFCFHSMIPRDLKSDVYQ